MLEYGQSNAREVQLKKIRQLHGGEITLLGGDFGCILVASLRVESLSGGEMTSYRCPFRRNSSFLTAISPAQIPMQGIAVNLGRPTTKRKRKSHIACKIQNKPLITDYIVTKLRFHGLFAAE